MHSSLFRTALVLGLLSAIGPFSIDMYLPAMPQIGAELGAPETRGADDHHPLLPGLRRVAVPLGADGRRLWAAGCR